MCVGGVPSLRKFMLLLSLFRWKHCSCSLWLPPGTLSREVLKVESGIALGKVKGPLAALISRVWDRRPRRPVDGGWTVSEEGLLLAKGLDEFFPPQGPMDFGSVTFEAPTPTPFLCAAEVGVVCGASCLG